MIFISVAQVLFDLDLIFTVHWSVLSFLFWSFFLRSSIFGVWNDCKVYMSSWQVSSDLGLIFRVQWSQLKFFSFGLFFLYYIQLVNYIWCMEIFYDLYVSCAGFIWPWPPFHSSLLSVFFFVLVCFYAPPTEEHYVFWSVCPSVRLFVRLFIHLSVRPSVRLQV